MTQSSSRRRRRAIKSVAKKAAKQVAQDKGIDISSEVSTDPSVQGIKIAALENNLEKFVKITQLNHKEILNAFSLVDAHQWVLLQIVKDIAAGTALMLSKDPPVLDVAAYYELFTARQRAEAAKASQKKAEGEDHEVFGGDLSDEDQERDASPEEGQGSGEVVIDAGDAQAPVLVRQPGGAPAGA